MNAIILAAGLGKRLRPITDNIPKCLARFAGVHLLDYQLAALASMGIKDVTVVGGYKSERLYEMDVNVILNERYESSNMVTSLFCAKEKLLQSEDTIIAYGDIIYEPRVLEAILASDAPISLVVDKEWRRYWAARMSNPLEDAETLLHDGEGRITELGKKPASYLQIQGQYIGLIKIRGDIAESLIDIYYKMDQGALYDGQDFHNMYMTSFLQYLIDSNWRVQAVFVENGWLEFDSLDDMRVYHNLLVKGQLSDYFDRDMVFSAGEGVAFRDKRYSNTWRSLIDTMQYESNRYSNQKSSDWRDNIQKFDTRDFVQLLLNTPSTIYAPHVWDVLDKLCWHIDVIKRVQKQYVGSLTDPLGDEEVDADCYLSLGILMFYAALAFEDLKFLNAGLKVIDTAFANGVKGSGIDVKGISRDIFQAASC